MTTPRRTMAWAYGCALFVCLLSAPSARADALQEGKELFDQARSLRLRGDCAGAVPLFRRALEVYPAGLGSVRNIAECEETLGHFASARRSWLELKSALVAHTERKYEGWGQDATDASSRLALKVAALTVAVREVTPDGKSAATTGVEVTVNGERLAPGMLGLPVERDPGHYVLVARAAQGAVAEERNIDLSAREDRRVELELVVAPPPNRDASASPGRRTARTAAWVAAGVGVAGFVGAGIAAIEFQSALGDRNALKDKCLQACATADLATQPSINDRGDTAATLVNVFLVVGAVGLVSGAALYLVGHTRSSQTALVVSPAGFAAAGSF